MKHTFIGALLLMTLLACSQNIDGDIIVSAEGAIVKLEEASSIINSINSIDDAKAVESKLSELGKDYSDLMGKISAYDQTDQEVALKLASLMPKVATTYQVLISEVNALQSRDTEAAQIVIDELKAFQPR
ncbi:hypothetical protein [Alteromonas facilis]|uniref:hypothetical protein n=1 Tax=Alteromonas facilis TaxID=2048004 RepID=UPI000C286227|nr:hypothetical protein [Alteromonas facilis]